MKKPSWYLFIYCYLFSIAMTAQAALPNATVAYFDTGIDYNHEAFRGRIISYEGQECGFNIVDENPCADETGWLKHGTMVGGIIALNFSDVSIFPIKTYVTSPLPFLQNAEGFKKALDIIDQLGIRVVSLSFGVINSPEETTNPFHEIMKQHSNILFVAAAGNDGLDLDGFSKFPSSRMSPNIIEVASMDRKNNRIAFEESNGKFSSNFGLESVQLASKGHHVKTTVPNDFYETLDGTSFAAPYVAAIASKIFKAHPEYSVDDVLKVLRSKCKKRKNLASQLKWSCYIP